MDSTRREFLKVSTIGGVAASVLGFDLTPAYAQVRELKIARTTETRSTCPYCSVSCGVILHTLGDRSRNVKPKIVHVEGDRRSPDQPGHALSEGHHAQAEHRQRPPADDRALPRAGQPCLGREILGLGDRSDCPLSSRQTRDERLMREGCRGPDDQRADRGRRDRRLHRYQRAQLPPRQGLPRRSRCRPDRAAGPNMTRPDGGQSGRHVRTGSDDQRLDRHPQRGCRPGHGRQSG